jgi:hypothetical protein
MAPGHRQEDQDHGTHLFLPHTPLTPQLFPDARADSDGIHGKQRRVKFPLEYDALDIATDTLREKLLPVSRRLKELEKERGERGKVRKRTKTVQPAPRDGDVEMRDAPPSDATDAPEPEAKTESVELQDEDVYRAKERAELEALVHPDIKADVGASVSGLYELIGAPPSFLCLHRPRG